MTLTARAPEDGSAPSFIVSGAPAAVPATPGGGPMTPSTQATPATAIAIGGGAAASSSPYYYGACTDGRGLGEPRECLALMNCQRRDDKVGGPGLDPANQWTGPRLRGRIG